MILSRRIATQQQRYWKRCAINNHRCCPTMIWQQHEQQRQQQNEQPNPVVFVGQLQLQQRRSFVSMEWLPELPSVWGASGFLLKTIHMDGTIPYWACFSIISVMLRMALFPVVLYGVRSAVRFGSIVPEAQFLFTLFKKDFDKMKRDNESWVAKQLLVIKNLETFKAIYKIKKIKPLSVLYSPLLQMPCFWYMSTDLRKICNGGDPALAQELQSSGFLWIPDLTDPDPWYGLPVLAGLFMYANMEIAFGRHSLSGQAASKANTGVLMKDVVQSLSIFMPCILSNSPGGMQIYVATSFLWTSVQSGALRYDPFRQLVGLPSIHRPPAQPKLAMEFIEFKTLEQKAIEAWGGNTQDVQGTGVLAMGFKLSFPGTTKRKTTIKGSPFHVQQQIQQQNQKNRQQQQQQQPVTKKIPEEATRIDPRLLDLPFIHGISAPPEQMLQQQKEREARQQAEQAVRLKQQELGKNEQQQQQVEYMPEISTELIEKANRGEVPKNPQIIPREEKTTNKKQQLSPTKLNVNKRFSRKKGASGGAKSGGGGKKKKKPSGR